MVIAEQTLDNYAAMVTALESPSEIISQQTAQEQTARLLHVGMGMVTEAGEIMDQLKKHIVYNRPLDEVNFKEELGDSLWYIQLGCLVLGINILDLLQQNMDKLKVRYGDKFDFDKQVNRDLNAERAILEGEAGAASRTTCNNLPNS